MHYEYDVVGINGMTAILNTTFWADYAQFVSGSLTPAFMTEELKKDLGHLQDPSERGGLDCRPADLSCV